MLDFGQCWLLNLFDLIGIIKRTKKVMQRCQHFGKRRRKRHGQRTETHDKERALRATKTALPGMRRRAFTVCEVLRCSVRERRSKAALQYIQEQLKSCTFRIYKVARWNALRNVHSRRCEERCSTVLHPCLKV